MGKRLTYEFVKSCFEKEGYELLSTEYKDAHTKLRCKCPQGHILDIVWSKFKNGRRCKFCNGSAIYFQDIKTSFESEGYTLLTTEREYKNDKQKLDYICPNNHKHSISYRHWLDGSRCKECAFISLRASPAKFKELVIEFGYTLLERLPGKFTKSTKVLCKCKYGHKFYTSWSLLSRGHRCKRCSYDELSIKYSGSNASNWQGGKSLEEYCAAWQDKDYKCDIKVRDENKCLNPYCHRTDGMLSIHHIDYNKQNCRPSNLITVCRSCNSRANKDRNWHKAWYRALMYRRYNYKY